jgi:hypothetical protein
MAQTSLNSTGVASSGSLVLQTNGTTSAVTVDTSQNVGVGVTPSAWSGSGARALQIGGISSIFQVSNNTYWGNNFYYDGTDKFYTTGYATRFVQNINTGVTNWQVSTASGTAGATVTYNTIMTLDASGNLLVGTTSAGGYKFNVTAGASYAAQLACTSGNVPLTCQITSGSGSQTYTYFYNGATLTGTITTTGTNTAYNSISDYRLKENIAPMTGALDVVKQLKPVTYKWKTDGTDGQGFIAHELQAVVPECVTGEKDAVDESGNPKYQAIDTSFLVATLTAAIQEQNQLITSLTERITALEGK